MTARSDRRLLLLTIAIPLLLGACSGSSGPAATSGPAGGATSAPGGSVSAPSNAIAAAGSAAAAGQAASGADACALLTKAEVEAAFKETMLVPVPSVDHGSAECSWAHETGGLDLTVKIDPLPSSAAAIKSLEAIYGDAETDVAGVGDAAFQVAGILEFVKGTTLVIIGTGDGPGIISDANFKDLTKLAAGRV